MKQPSFDVYEMLRVFREHDVDFIVVGGVCGIFHGAPIPTYDLDLVRSCDDENVGKMIRALEAIHGFSRQHTQDVRPSSSALSAKGHVLLRTKFGPLDLLGMIGDQRDFSYLNERTQWMVLRGVKFKILDLKTLIQTKEETGRNKDLVHLPVLRAVLDESN